MIDEIKVGSIVQIVDENHGWFPAVLIVDEVKSWGVVAYVVIPKSNIPKPNDGSEDAGLAYNRLKFEQVVYIGTAEVTIG